jgi:hypothetical protein
LPAHFSSIETASAADRPSIMAHLSFQFFFNSLMTHRMVLTSHDGTAMIGTPWICR